MKRKNLFCKCGCGEITNIGKDFIRGHHLKTQERISKLEKQWKDPSYRKKMCKMSKDKGLSTNTRKAIIKANKNRVWSVESKKKISDSLKGRKLSNDTKRKISNGNKGKVVSIETRRKMSKTWIRIFKDPQKHPGWQGGKSFEIYPSEWTEELREGIRERDNYECQHPGCRSDAFGSEEELNIHHIDYIKKNCDPDNLISLCRSCNVRVNADRSYWEAVFKNIIRSNKVPYVEGLVKK